ncbi:MAG: antifreeze protein [Pseudomonadota bacterium]
MRPLKDPYAIAWTSIRLANLWVETQMVVAYRVLGMVGIWSVTEAEKRRMIEEKTPAFVESATAASIAILRARNPADIMEAAMQPIERKAKSNRRRLAKRGFAK